MKRTSWMALLALVAVVTAGLVLLVSAVLAQGDEPGLVVFASDRTGNYEIYVLDPQTGQMTQLTNDPGDDIEPAWSPDGQFIAFVSDRDGDYELFVMRADGSDLRQLTANNAEDRYPSWQPGGAHLVYASDVNNQWDLYSISADGAIVRQLTNDPIDERGPGWGVEEGVAGGPAQAVPSPTPQPVASPTPSLPDGTVNSFSLNVRANPGEGANILTQVQRNDPVTIVGRYYDNSWIQIRLNDGRLGWVYAPLVDININLNDVQIVNAPFIAPPPTATPTPAATATSSVLIEFYADRYTINSGECVTISWNTSGIDSVYYEGDGVVGVDQRQECPTATYTYHLRVLLRNGSEENRYVTITVN